MEPLLLGIDIGTSACKLALFTAEGAVAATGGGDYPVAYPRPGWAEQEPGDWWAAVCAGLQKMLGESGIAPGRIAGVGVDGQSWSAIPVDGAGNALCPTPIWMDTRAAAICASLEEGLRERAFAVGGNPLTPCYSLPKMLWMKANRPAVFGKASKFLQSNGYIVAKLTGAMTQDVSQGYGLCCFDMRRVQWDLSLCRELGLPPSLLPELAPCHAVVGGVSREAARQTGLLAGTPVVAGGLDAACGALGAGVLCAGETQEQGGQAGGMGICLETCLPHPRLILSRHVVPGRWLLQGGTVGGGGVARWLMRELGAAERQAADASGKSPFYEMDKAAARIPPGSQGVVFLPYMAGERSPIWDAHAKGVFYGLDFSKTRAHLYRAGLEGVAFSLRHNLETAAQAGAAAGELRAVGGAANSRLWTQIKADVTGKRIAVASADTATTLGAALLAGVGTGAYGSFQEAVAKTVRVTRVHEPSPGARAGYEAGYQTYLALYRRLGEIMAQGGGPQPGDGDVL